jgi:hypothetical protein
LASFGWALQVVKLGQMRPLAKLLDYQIQILLLDLGLSSMLWSSALTFVNEPLMGGGVVYLLIPEYRSAYGSGDFTSQA